MPNKILMIGKRFGRLTVIEEISKDKHGHPIYRCHCDCGNTAEVDGGHLRSGHTKSCGCLRNELTSKRRATHRMSGSRLYRIWSGMKERCACPLQKAYADYGGRGVKVCDEWQEFEPFRDWAISHGYRDNLTIDRIDVNGGYSPDNCKWIPPEDQAQNKRNTLRVELNGTPITLMQLSREYSIPYTTLQRRYNDGIRDERILQRRRG